MSQSKKDGAIHYGHRQRMYSKLKNNGASAFESHELLEILLYASNKRCDTNPIAHALLDKFGTLSSVITANERELMKVDGVGASTAQLILSVRAVIERALEESVMPGEELATTLDTKEYCAGLFRLAKREEVRLLLLDSNLRLIKQELISEGSIDKVGIDMMKIIETVIARRCNIVILTHNHPRGSELPSREDKLFTRNLFNLLEKADIYLADHIIIGANGAYSMCESGSLPDLWRRS